MPVYATLLTTTPPLSPARGWAVAAFAKSGDWLVWCDNLGDVLSRYHIPSSTLYRDDGGGAGWRTNHPAGFGIQNVSSAVVRPNGNVCIIRTSDNVSPQSARRCVVYEVDPATGVTTNWQPPLDLLGRGCEFGSSLGVAVVSDVAFDSGWAHSSGSGSLPTVDLVALDLNARTAVRYHSLGSNVSSSWRRESVYASGSVWIAPLGSNINGLGVPILRVNPSTLAVTSPVTYNHPIWQDLAPMAHATEASGALWWGTERPFGTGTEDYWRLDLDTLEFDAVPGTYGGRLSQGLPQRADGLVANRGTISGGTERIGLWQFPDALVEPAINTESINPMFGLNTAFNHLLGGDGVVAYGVGYNTAGAPFNLHLWRFDFGPDVPPDPPTFGSGGIYRDGAIHLAQSVATIDPPEYLHRIGTIESATLADWEGGYGPLQVGDLLVVQHYQTRNAVRAPGYVSDFPASDPLWVMMTGGWPRISDGDAESPNPFFGPFTRRQVLWARAYDGNPATASYTITRGALGGRDTTFTFGFVLRAPIGGITYSDAPATQGIDGAGSARNVPPVSPTYSSLAIAFWVGTPGAAAANGWTIVTDALFGAMAYKVLPSGGLTIGPGLTNAGVECSFALRGATF